MKGGAKMVTDRDDLSREIVDLTVWFSRWETHFVCIGHECSLPLFCTTKTWSFPVTHYFLWRNYRMCSPKICCYNVTHKLASLHLCLPLWKIRRNYLPAQNIFERLLKVFQRKRKFSGYSIRTRPRKVVSSIFTWSSENFSQLYCVWFLFLL